MRKAAARKAAARKAAASEAAVREAAVPRDRESCRAALEPGSADQDLMWDN